MSESKPLTSPTKSQGGAAKRALDQAAVNLHFALQIGLRSDILRTGWRERRVLRRILVVVIVAGLAACAMRAEPQKPAPHAAAAPPPQPADGLWAILDPGCSRPSAANFHAWPSCASPFWIAGDKAMVLTTRPAERGHRPHSVPYAAGFSLTAGEPIIAQVGTEKDGYLYLALTHLTEDDRGRLVGAVGAAIACPGADGHNLAAKPNLNGCDLVSLDTVRKAAISTLQDRSALAQVTWIAPGQP
jgi:hypothetical protein